MRLYIYKSYGRLGPYVEGELRQGLSNRTFSLDDPASAEGETERKPLREFWQTE